jgi:hypothetical protein
MKNAIFLDMMPRGSCKNRRFGGTYCLHRQGENNDLGKTLAVISILLADSFQPGVGGDTFLPKRLFLQQPHDVTSLKTEEIFHYKFHLLSSVCSSNFLESVNATV